jgi:hypothetical protein
MGERSAQAICTKCRLHESMISSLLFDELPAAAHITFHETPSCLHAPLLRPPISKKTSYSMSFCLGSSGFGRYGVSTRFVKLDQRMSQMDDRPDRMLTVLSTHLIYPHLSRSSIYRRIHEDERRREAVIKRMSIFNLIDFFCRELDTQCFNIALQMRDFTSSNNWEDIGCLVHHICQSML